MPRVDDYTRRAIRFWEIRRAIFCGVVALPAWFAHMLFSGIQAGLDYPQTGTALELTVRYAWAFVLLNICYTFAYAAEFLFRSENPSAFWPTAGRHLTFVPGLLLGCYFAFCAGAQIGIFEFSFRNR